MLPFCRPVTGRGLRAALQVSQLVSGLLFANIPERCTGNIPERFKILEDTGAPVGAMVDDHPRVDLPGTNIKKIEKFQKLKYAFLQSSLLTRPSALAGPTHSLEGE